ncbi:unnamed protein product [Amoebophrya sp. A120]|nr:unnamed protein product [Amoebophrya sp. A120]|eukprot:GSA120T00000363001.1
MRLGEPEQSCTAESRRCSQLVVSSIPIVIFMLAQQAYMLLGDKEKSSTTAFLSTTSTSRVSRSCSCLRRIIVGSLEVELTTHLEKYAHFG